MTGKAASWRVMREQSNLPILISSGSVRVALSIALTPVEWQRADIDILLQTAQLSVGASICICDGFIPTSKW